jgi:hypothetical protein
MHPTFIRGSLVAASILLSACAAQRAPALPDSTVVADRLFLGRAIPTGGEVGEEQWRAFVDQVVTPRFPDGLTLWHAQGQWRDPRGTLVRENVLVLEVFHAPSATADSALDSIAREYIRRFNQDAVLHVRGSAVMRLIE